MKNNPGAPGSGRKTASDLGNPGNGKMKEMNIMKNKWRVPGSGRRKQGKSVGFMCKWRGFVWLREERGRGLGLDLGVSQSPIMKEMKIMKNKCLRGQISGAVKTDIRNDFGLEMQEFK